MRFANHENDYLVHTWGIEDASPFDLTINCGDHRVVVGFPDGITEDHYTHFGSIDQDSRPILALAVLRRLVNTSVDWEHILIQEYGPDVDEFLPAMVEKAGFAAVAAFIKRKVVAYRRKNSPHRMYLSVVRSPRWYAPILYLGDMRWHFKEQNGPTQRLLDALEANDWRPWVQLPDLDPDQVRDAAKYLRRKTGTHLEWHAEADGRLQWMLRK